MAHSPKKKLWAGALSALLALFAAVVVATPALATTPVAITGGLTVNGLQVNAGNVTSAGVISSTAGDVEITGTATGDTAITLGANYKGTVTFSNVKTITHNLIITLTTDEDVNIEFAGTNAILTNGTFGLFQENDSAIAETDDAVSLTALAGSNTTITGSNAANGTITGGVDGLSISGPGTLTVNNTDDGHAISVTGTKAQGTAADQAPKGLVIGGGVNLTADGAARTTPESQAGTGNGINVTDGLLDIQEGTNVTASGDTGHNGVSFTAADSVSIAGTLTAKGGNGVYIAGDGAVANASVKPAATIAGSVTATGTGQYAANTMGIGLIVGANFNNVTISGTVNANGSQYSTAAGLGMFLDSNTTVSGDVTAVGGGNAGDVETVATGRAGALVDANLNISGSVTATGGAGTAAAGNGFNVTAGETDVTGKLTAAGGSSAGSPGAGINLAPNCILDVKNADGATLNVTGGVTSEGVETPARTGSGLGVVVNDGQLLIEGGTVNIAGGNGNVGPSGVYGVGPNSSVTVGGGNVTITGGSVPEGGTGVGGPAIMKCTLSIMNYKGTAWEGPTLTLIGGSSPGAERCAIVNGTAADSGVNLNLLDGVTRGNTLTNAVAYPWLALTGAETADTVAGFAGMTNPSANLTISGPGSDTASPVHVVEILPAKMTSLNLGYTIARGEGPAGWSADAENATPGNIITPNYEGGATFTGLDGTVYTLKSDNPVAQIAITGSISNVSVAPETNGTVAKTGAVTVTDDASGLTTSVSANLPTTIANLYEGTDLPVAAAEVPMFYQVTLDAGAGQFIPYSATSDETAPYLVDEYTYYTQPGTGRLLGSAAVVPYITDPQANVLGNLPNCTIGNGTYFQGWFTEETGGERLAANATFDHDQTIYAQYGDSAPVTGNAVEVTRLVNPYNNEHLFTTDALEIKSLVTSGWAIENDPAWYAPTTGVPVYRLYNPYSHDHYYTPSKSEADGLDAIGWDIDFGGAPAFYGAESVLHPVYQLFNPYVTEGTHLWTTEWNEIETNMDLGWKYEGAKWFAQSLPVVDNSNN